METQFGSIYLVGYGWMVLSGRNIVRFCFAMSKYKGVLHIVLCGVNHNNMMFFFYNSDSTLVIQKNLVHISVKPE